MSILQETEDQLCHNAEKAGHPSSKLAEKFWNEVRRYFPAIDLVGVVVKKSGKQ
jgi:hypothetical protein